MFKVGIKISWGNYFSLETLCEASLEIPINKQTELINHKTPEVPMLNDAFSEPIELLCSKVFIASKSL